MGSFATLPRLDVLPARRSRLGLVTLILTAACNHESPTQPLAQVPPGTWGGLEIAMTVTRSGATLQQTCASGTLDQPLLLDAASHFDVTGKYTRQVGGPVRPEAHPARYTGSIDGNTLTLMVMETDDGLTFGPFTLTFGTGTAVGPCPLL